MESKFRCYKPIMCWGFGVYSYSCISSFPKLTSGYVCKSTKQLHICIRSGQILDMHIYQNIMRNRFQIKLVFIIQSSNNHSCIC